MVRIEPATNNQAIYCATDIDFKWSLVRDSGDAEKEIQPCQRLHPTQNVIFVSKVGAGNEKKMEENIILQIPASRVWY